MGDPEDVAKRVTHHGPAISVRRFPRLLHRESACIEGAPIGRIGIVDIDEKKARNGSRSAAGETITNEFPIRISAGRRYPLGVRGKRVVQGSKRSAPEALYGKNSLLGGRILELIRIRSAQLGECQPCMQSRKQIPFPTRTSPV